MNVTKSGEHQRKCRCYELFLSARPDPNIAAVDGSTWPNTAFLNDCCTEAFQVIIDHGADVNATNKQNNLKMANKR